jgi:decaprenyl-phosphate phosphoribosyltransferase
MNVSAFILLMRPWQWLKNLMIFFPPLLSGAMSHPGVAERGLLPFAAFCLASSSSYVFNDLFDHERDVLHPVKKKRPLPSGQLSRLSAAVFCCILFVLAIVLSWQVSSVFLALVLVYLLVVVSYSMYLKSLPILDVFCISLGFVLRLYGGGEAFNIVISDWLFLTVFLLATFLSVGKRYSERRYLGDTAGGHRCTLEAYPEGFLEGIMYLSGAAVLVTYSIYAISTPFLVFTVPLCMYGLLRYLMRVMSGQSGDPSESLVKDIPLLITSILWVLLVGWSVYR